MPLPASSANKLFLLAKRWAGGVNTAGSCFRIPALISLGVHFMDKANGIRGFCPGRLGRRALDVLSVLLSELLAMGRVELCT